jgi:hypothetical protein
MCGRVRTGVACFKTAAVAGFCFMRGGSYVTSRVILHLLTDVSASSSHGVLSRLLQVFYNNCFVLTIQQHIHRCTRRESSALHFYDTV